MDLEKSLLFLEKFSQVRVDNTNETFIKLKNKAISVENFVNDIILKTYHKYCNNINNFFDIILEYNGSNKESLIKYIGNIETIIYEVD